MPWTEIVFRRGRITWTHCCERRGVDDEDEVGLILLDGISKAHERAGTSGVTMFMRE
jgi:hypothetical protein